MDIRQLSISTVRECRHLWVGGICVKCGVSQNEIIKEEHENEQSK